MVNKITFIESPTEKDHGAIYHGMNHYAAQHGFSGTGGYFYVAYDGSKNIIAAISGFDNFGPAEIGDLWVDEQNRHQGYGKALVQNFHQGDESEFKAKMMKSTKSKTKK